MQKSLMALIRGEVQAAGGWLPFDRFMTLALYAPGLGYYANASRKFGHMPESGSDFVTAPELTPYFGRALAVQVRQALEVTGTDTVWEFGAGSGALAEQVLQALGDTVRCYTIVDVSGELRERQHPVNFYFTSTIGELICDYISGKISGTVNTENIELRKSTII